MNSLNGNGLSEHAQLMVKFFTKNPKYAIADNPYSIASNSTSDILNSLIKSILKEDLVDEENDFMSLEFDFYINGHFLLSNLNDLIQAHSEIKVESVIEIEYTERHPAPEPLDTVIVDDWVSSIKGINDYILIGSYDNSVQIWNTKGELVNNISGHTGPVKSVNWLSIDDDNKFKFLSSSHDQSVIIWYWNKNKKKLERTDKCIGHTESVECVDVYSDKTKFISGSWDKMIKLWSLAEDDLVEESTNKKKKSDMNSSVKINIIKTPIITLSGHTENVSSCKWMDDKNICSASWDHSIKLWDVFIGQETRTMKSSNKIYLSIDYSSLKNLIAAGLNDNLVRLYDPRSIEGNLVKISLSSHTGWCSSVCWSKTNENQLLTGSYDTKAKLWDIRNAKSSMYDMLGHEDKVLCVDWSIQNLMLTGSADNTFKMYKT